MVGQARDFEGTMREDNIQEQKTKNVVEKISKEIIAEIF